MCFKVGVSLPEKFQNFKGALSSQVRISGELYLWMAKNASSISCKGVRRAKKVQRILDNTIQFSLGNLADNYCLISKNFAVIITRIPLTKLYICRSYVLKQKPNEEDYWCNVPLENFKYNNLEFVYEIADVDLLGMFFRLD